MRIVVTNLGRFNVTLIITLVSVVASILLTLAILKLTGSPVTPLFLYIAAFVPTVIAPIVTWPIVGLVCQIDILEKQLREHSHVDQLTGLMSRRYFFESAERYFDIATRYGKTFSILLLDLDHFKKINDTYGHVAGDAALRFFGAQINEFRRESDFVGRYGGEEFIFLLPETEGGSALSFAEKVRRKTEETPVIHQDQSIPVTVSIGVATFEPGDRSETLVHLIHEADKALYSAKEAGRNRVVAFVKKADRESSKA